MMNKINTLNCIQFNGKLHAKFSVPFLAFVVLLMFSQCSSSDESGLSSDNSSDLVFRADASDVKVLNNTLLYVFDNTNKFKEQTTNNITRQNNVLTASYFPAGTWNIVLLSCLDLAPLSKIKVPAKLQEMKDAVMWETESTSGYLNQTPELLYAKLANTVVVANTPNAKSATLQRNVAKIQVVLKEYHGFDALTTANKQFAFVELHNVPTKLSWEGKYLPNLSVPTTGNPMKEFFVFDNQFKADTVNFIVPAHRGENANDTTTNKLKLKVSLPLYNQSFYGKTETPIEISYVPKINSIVRVELTFMGEPEADLDIKVTVKDWENPINQSEEFN